MKNVAVPALLISHLCGGLVSAFFSANQPAISSAIFLGIIFCQTSLLGMWAGLGTTPWPLRFVGFLAGTVYLYLVCGLGISELDSEIFLLTALPGLLIAAVCGAIRLLRGGMRRPDENSNRDDEALQFNIRHLMLLTLVVACLTAAGKLVAPTIGGLDTIAQIIVLGICYTAVALTSIWAMLGTGRPFVRSIFVLLIAVSSGALAGYVVDNRMHMVFWLSTTLLQAVLLVGSLSLVRADGYRFVANRAVAAE